MESGRKAVVTKVIFIIGLTLLMGACNKEGYEQTDARPYAAALIRYFDTDPVEQEKSSLTVKNCTSNLKQDLSTKSSAFYQKRYNTFPYHAGKGNK